MLTLPRSVRIFAALKPVDMRCGFDKLGAMVAEMGMGMDVYSGHLFAFASKRGDRIKILAWDHGGFVLWYKRLERGRFKLPKRAENEATIALDGPSLAMLLDGVDYARVRRPKHWQPKVRGDDRLSATNVIQRTPDVAGRLRRAGSNPAGDDGVSSEDRGGPAGGPLVLDLSSLLKDTKMTSLKIDAYSYAGEIFAADIKSGAVAFDDAKGAFFKPSKKQEYLRTTQDRLVRYDGVVGVLNEYSKSSNEFFPIDALRDGEKFDRARKLTANDILAKPTWGQWAGDATLLVAQGAVAGAALGAVGGAIYGFATHRRALPDNSVDDNTAAVSLRSHNAGGGGVAGGAAALRTPYDGPFNPGQLNPPGHIDINMPPPPDKDT